MGYPTHSRDDPRPEEPPRGISPHVRWDRPPHHHWPQPQQDSHREEFPTRIPADSKRISYLGRNNPGAKRPLPIGVLRHWQWTPTPKTKCRHPWSKSLPTFPRSHPTPSTVGFPPIQRHLCHRPTEMPSSPTKELHNGVYDRMEQGSLRSLHGHVQQAIHLFSPITTWLSNRNCGVIKWYPPSRLRWVQQ